jgi:type II secretory pathway pseudopilin PulG
MTPIRADLHRPAAWSSGRARPPAVAAAVATALGVFLAPNAMSQTASASDVQALKSQVQQLQRKIDQLEAQQAQTTPVQSNTMEATTLSPVVQAGPVTLTFGGFAALESVYRNKNQTADIASNYNTGIPFTYQPNAHISEFRETARQSRFSLLAEGPKTGSLRAESYLETDFLSAGVTSNSAESNSYTMRVRHFYGVLRDSGMGWYVLGGQNWSFATLYTTADLNPRTERIPQTIDAQYVVGFNWLRVPQLRFVKLFDVMGKKVSAGISLETPQASFYTGCNTVATPAPTGCGTPPSAITTMPGGTLLNSTANYSIDFAPDIIVKAAADPGYGHYEVYGLGRGFRDRSPGTAAGSNNTTWGGSVGAGMILPLVENLEFQASGLFGAGNGRYGSAQLPDATLRPDGTVAAIREWQALGGFVYKPVPELTLYVYAGEEKASRTAYTNAAGTAGIGYGSALYNNSGCYSLTGTASTCIGNTNEVQQIAVGEWYKVYQGAIGNFQIGLQYSYLERRTFSGVGGSPIANINMGFFSFRYYPFQK